MVILEIFVKYFFNSCLIPSCLISYFHKHHRSRRQWSRKSPSMKRLSLELTCFNYQNMLTESNSSKHNTCNTHSLSCTDRIRMNMMSLCNVMLIYLKTNTHNVFPSVPFITCSCMACSLHPPHTPVRFCNISSSDSP